MPVLITIYRMFTRFAFISLLFLTACQNADNLKDPGTPDIQNVDTTIVETDKDALDTVRAPVAKSTLDSDLETDDLTVLRAELEALNKDLVEIRQDLVQADATNVIPDTSISTPRALPTNEVVAIPNSLEEEVLLETAVVNNLRVGTHPDKTRLVFEIMNHNQSNPEIKLNGKLVSFQIVNAKWPDAAQQFSSLEDQVGIFKVDQERDNLNVTILLNKDMRIKSTDMLPPSETGGARRLVIDLAPL